MYRTKTCGELNISNVNEEVELAGWIQKIRDLGAMVFIVLIFFKILLAVKRNLKYNIVGALRA